MPHYSAYKQIFAVIVTFQVAQLLTVCTPSTVNADELDIKVIVESYYSVMSKRDWKVYRKFFYEKATITTIWQSSDDKKPRVHVVSIDEFIEQTPAGPDSKPIFSEHMNSFEVDQRGDLAIVWAGYHATFGDENELMEWDGVDVFTLMRFEGEWRIVSLAFQAN